MLSRLKSYHAFLVDHLYDLPMKRLIIIGLLSLVFYFFSYILWAYEFVMNANPLVALNLAPATNLFNEGIIGYSLLALIGVTAYFWVKCLLRLPIEIQSYQSSVLNNSTSTLEGVTN
jgi:hypothetical protein